MSEDSPDGIHPGSANPSGPSGPQSRLMTLIAAVMVLNVLGLAYVVFESARAQSAMATLQTQSKHLERGIDLLRYEATSQYEGHGFHALLDHLTFWAPQLRQASAGTLEFYDIEDRVRKIVEVMSQLPDVFDRIDATIRDGGITAKDPATDDEIRKWLLRAGLAADPSRGRDLYADLLRATGIDVSSRLRRVAVRELIDIDKVLTGEILHEILAQESARGIKRPGAPGQPEHRRRQPQFYNFIDYYVASGHPQAAQTLLGLLSHAEHDLLTKQACVKALGNMGYRPAAERLQGLYREFHTPHAGQVPNPVFRLKIVNAVVQILGADAAEFLREVDQKESSPAIRARLTALKKEIGF